MKLKKCKECLKTKPLTDFHKHWPSPDGRKPRCKVCRNTAEKRARKNPYCKATMMFHDMLRRLRKQPEYAHVWYKFTREEFLAWARPELEKFMKQFPNETPSLDRIDSEKDYEFGNIRIISLRENCARSRRTSSNTCASQYPS